MKFKNIICFFLGHRWSIGDLISGEAKNINTGETVPYIVGCERVCLRCGKKDIHLFYPRM